MKVLFLDIDGVLNNFKDRNFGKSLSKASCENLNTLLKKVPDLKIVISSAWRHNGLEFMKEMLNENNIDGKRVIDITGNENGIRGYQIQCWLDRNPEVTNCVIIDDDSDMGELMNKLVKTNSFVGLTSKAVEQAEEVLKTSIK